MNRGSVLIIFSIFCFSCSREKSSSIAEVDKTIEPFFETYRINGPGIAIDRLLATNKYIPKNEADSVSVRLARLVRGFGDFQGVDRISVEEHGKTLIDLTYLVNYSKQPIRFNFQFYQPGTGWRIQNFSYQSEFDLKRE
jgi:hypothetical protein